MARAEQVIFDELSQLCRSPGYAHAIAFFCFRDNTIKFDGLNMRADDLMPMLSNERLSRTEIASLVGLMIKTEVDLTIPDAAAMQQYIDRTDTLLKEIHVAMSLSSFRWDQWQDLVNDGKNPFESGGSFREPIFYGGESAYMFQYGDLAVRKYGADNQWLQDNKHFSIQTAKSVADALGRIHNQKLHVAREVMLDQLPHEWTFLPAYSFTAAEVALESGVDVVSVGHVLAAFTLPAGARNERFLSLHDFNAITATPLIKLDDAWLLFQTYNVFEALYEAPFYWMSTDATYRAVAMQHRGSFTEEFARERLALVFGTENVYANVDIYEAKGKRLGEIDVLVAFGDRAIVLQAKSKRLTLEARKGNDQAIKDDFKKSV
jgi:hypothetical protein